LPLVVLPSPITASGADQGRQRAEKSIFQSQPTMRGQWQPLIRGFRKATY
jgi:hypothetical protein